jgi:hypothetical protein
MYAELAAQEPDDKDYFEKRGEPHDKALREAGRNPDECRKAATGTAEENNAEPAHRALTPVGVVA